MIIRATEDVKAALSSGEADLLIKLYKHVYKREAVYRVYSTL